MRCLLGSAGCRRSILVATCLLLAAACLPVAAAVPASPPPYAYAANEPTLLFRIERALPGDPDRPRHAVRISRIAVEKALASRRLPVQLPDGQRYVLAVEREETADTGDLTLIARLDGALGRQSAVLTLGSHAVFGVLPTPDGRVYQLSTRHGVSVLEPAAGIRPLGLDDETIGTDVLLPPQASTTDEASVARRKESPAARTSRHYVQAAAADGEVEVDVLGVYASNLVSVNGSVQAAETEFVNQIAVSNQAYLDSGTVVRLRLVGMRESDIAPTAMNLDVLNDIQANDLADGLDVHGLRDSSAADLVAVLRPHADGDGSCGIAWLSGWDLNPTQADAEYGYSVNNVGSACGPYVMAHEFGHNLGSHHDVETALAGNSGSFGAYPYSYGYRQDGPPNFATVMAYQKSWQQTWLGQFSRPDTTACQGVACGVAQQADNVRSLNQMAPRIARFRDPPGTVSVLDAIGLEGDDGSHYLNFVVRLASPAPAGGVSFDIATVDGTAIAGSDYQAVSITAASIAAGQRSYEFRVNLIGDAVAEPEESLQVRISNVVGATVFDAEAIGIIRDDDDKVTLSGRVTFMADTPVPTSGFQIRFRSSDGELTEYDDVGVLPPSFRYEVAVRKGNRVWAEIDAPPAPYVRLHEDLGSQHGGAVRDFDLKRRPKLSLRVRFPQGAALPEQPVSLTIMGGEGDPARGVGLVAFPPAFAIETDVVPDADVVVFSDPLAPFLPSHQPVGVIDRDMVVDVTLEAGVVISGRLNLPDGLRCGWLTHRVHLLPREGDQPYFDTYADSRDCGYEFVIPAGISAHYDIGAIWSAAPLAWFWQDFGSVQGGRRFDIDVPFAPRLQIDDAIIASRDGQRFADFRVSLEQPLPSRHETWLVLQTRNGDALDGRDYTGTTELVRFLPGEREKLISVPLVGASQPATDRVFFLDISQVYGLWPISYHATAKLLAAGESGEPTLWLDDVTVSEGDQARNPLSLRVRLSRPAPASGVQVRLRTNDGSALSTQDYEAIASATITIPAGAESASATLSVIGDDFPEGIETFDVSATEVTGAAFAGESATVSILDDDAIEAPHVRNDHYAVPRNGSLAARADIGVLANDTHPRQDNLTIYEPNAYAPQHGSVELQQDGSLVYTPEAGYSGSDSFVYNLCERAPNVIACALAKVEFSVVDSLSTSDQYLWLVPPASNEQQQGFIRLINRENASGTVTVFGIDTVGRRSTGTITLTLGAKQSTHFNSQDLELGNTTKGLAGSLGSGDGNWMLVVRSELDIDALAYIRTPDGFVTSMHDRVEGDGVDWVLPLFNPASNPNQVSRLRVVNSTLAPVDVAIVGIDDAGQTGQDTITTTLPPLASREYDATDLEQGNAAKGLIGKLGDGEGKWRLTVSATDRITVQSLLADPMGYLTNLSTFSTSTVGNDQVLWMVTPAEETQQQGFLRLTNLSNRAGTLTLWGVDDRGQRSPGTASLALAANATQHLNSQDLENGNTAKGLTGSLGNGEGDWRIFLSTDLDLLPMGLIRTPNGFVTTMHDLVLENSRNWRVPMFNPGSNPNQVSVLRVVNPGNSAINVSIAGVDDAGQSSPGGTASFTLAANAAVEFTAQELEQGSAARGLVGSLGDGNGKWWLQVSADAEVKVISMLRDPNGYLTNLSNETRSSADQLDP